MLVLAFRFLLLSNEWKYANANVLVPYCSAPISKVIEYLPPNIPRILINRTVVHPSTTPAEVDDDDENDDDTEKEFRESYVFDAYLLGFCDDVTRALARQLFKPPETPTTTPDSKKRRRTTKADKQQQQQDSNVYGIGRRLTTVLKGEDDELDAKDWRAITVPPNVSSCFLGRWPPPMTPHPRR